MYMRNQLIYLSACLFFACSSSNTEDTSIQKDTATAPMQDTVNTLSTTDSITPDINWDEPDMLKLAKLKEYTADWDNTYFPLPSPSMLKRYSQIDPGYLYVARNFDSLYAKRTTGYYGDEKEHSDSHSLTECSWEQEFKTDIWYTNSTCSESGEEVVIHTNCPDKKVLVRLVDILYHATENSWNADSSKYEPIEQEAGCYFEVKKNENNGYDIKYYCGC